MGLFGGGGNEMEQLVNKHQWDKISKKLHSADAQSKASLATACGASMDEDSLNTLIKLLSDSDDNVLMQTVKSLGNVGGDNAKTHLQSLYGRLPDDKDSLKKAILDSIAKIKVSNRR